MTLVFSKEPFLLHVLAKENTITALGAVKQALDNGTHNVNELEPDDNLSALHIAAHYNNLPMCQLLVHYGADINALDIDRRAPIDMATGPTRKFFKKLRRKCKKSRLKRVLSYIFYSSRNKANSLLAINQPPILNESLINNQAASFSTLPIGNISTVNPPLLSDQCSSFPMENVSFNKENVSNEKIVRERSKDSNPNTTYNTAIVYLDQKPSLNSRSYSPEPIISNEINFISLDNTAESPISDLKQPKNDKNISDESYFTANQNKRNNNSQCLSEDNCISDHELNINSDEEETPLIPESPQEIELRNRFSKLTINELKQTLLKNRCPVGPIDERNRYVYERRLFKITMNVSKGIDVDENRYSLPLQRLIHDEEKNGNETRNMGEAEELAIRSEYSLAATTTSARKEIDYFCYLLIDPSMIPNLLNCSFCVFIKAIFYVGKGRRGRPLQHLIDAVKCRKLVKDVNYKCTNKLRRILDLWDQGHGVISLHINQNIHSAEAFVREGSMIDSIGIENLTNIRRGNFNGVAANWTHFQIAGFGASLLRKAHVVFRNERCRPIFEADAKLMLETWKPFYPSKKA